MQLLCRSVGQNIGLKILLGRPTSRAGARRVRAHCDNKGNDRGEYAKSPENAMVAASIGGLS